MSSKTGTMTDRLTRAVKKGKQGILLASFTALCFLVVAAVAVNARSCIDENEAGIASSQLQDGEVGETTTLAAPLDAPGPCLPQFRRPELLAEVQSEGVPYVLVAVDLDQDGLVDLFSLPSVHWNTTPIEPVVLLNDGSGGLRDATAQVFDGPLPRIAGPAEIIVAEFNGDGRPDLFVADAGIDNWPWSGEQNVLILSAPDGKLVDATGNLPQQTDYTHNATAADIDGDGDIDLYLGNYHKDEDDHIPPQFWLNDGVGHFSRGEGRLPAVLTDPYEGRPACLLADVNGDGSPDLVLGGSGGDFRLESVVLLNDGQGWFSLLPGAMPPQLRDPEDSALDVQATDLNADEHLDLVLLFTVDYESSYIQILIGNGDGTFRDETDSRLPPEENDTGSYHHFRLIDLDYDGDLDVASHPLGWDDPASFYFNDGLGYFTAWEQPLALIPFEFGDLDGDGRRDLLFALDHLNVVPDRYFAMRGLPCPAAFLPLVIKAGESPEPVVDGIVHVYDGSMSGEGWTAGETLSVDVRTPTGALKDTTFGTADSQGELRALFHIPHGQPVEGDRITLIPTDGASVTFPVRRPRATADPRANTIAGVAEPGVRVEAGLWRPPDGPSAWLETVAAADGAFSLDFSPVFDWAASDRLDVGQWVTDYAAVFISEDSPEMTWVGSAHINLGEPYQTLDPAFAASGSDFHVANQLFAGLTRQDEETGQILPDLASSWEIAPDGKSIAFRLPRGSLSWSNGDPMTVEDVARGLRRGQQHSPYSYILDAIGFADIVEGTTEVFRVSLDKPMAGVVPAVMAMPSFRPVPHLLIDAYGDAWADPDTIASSGPFRVVAEGPGLLELERNPYYHDVASVTISEVDLYAIEDALEATQRYVAGDLDVTMTYDEDTVNNDPVLKEQVHRYTHPCTTYFGFTTTKPPLDNALVRKALIAATDRAGIVAAGYGEAPALTFAPPGVFGAVSAGSGIGIDFDPTQAQRWLDQSDVATPFTITLAHNTGAGHAAIAQRITDDWETNLGIHVVIESRDWEDYQIWISPDTPVEAMPHAWRMVWCADYFDQHNWVYENFNSEGGSNLIRWSDAEFDDITNQAAASGDLAQRGVWYQRAEEILNEEQAGILSLYWFGDSQLSKPYLERTFSRNIGEQIRNWYFR